MLVNITHLKYFATAVESGSLSAAAAKLFITTQGISKAVGDLEREIGTKLLVRENRGVRPTEFGKEFYRRCIIVLHAFEDFNAFAHSYEESPGQPPVKVCVCAPNFLAMNRVSQGITALAKNIANVHVSVSFRLPKDCAQALESGEADLAILIGKHDAKYTSLPLGTLPCGIQISHENPLLERNGPPHVTDVLDHTIYLWPKYDYFNNSVRAYFKERGFDKELIEKDSAIETLSLLDNPRAVMMFPRITALDDDSYETCALTFHPQDDFTIPVSLAVLKGHDDTLLRGAHRLIVQKMNALAAAVTTREESPISHHDQQRRLQPRHP